MAIDVQDLGKYLKEAVKQYDKDTFYAFPDEDLWGVGSTVIPSEGDLKFGLKEIVSFRKEYIGRAAVSIGAYDIPLVDNAKSSRSNKVLTVVASTEWSYEQLQTHQFAQSAGILPTENLIQTNVESISVACNRRIHELVLYGMPEVDYYGFLNNNQVDLLDESGVEVLQLSPEDLYNWFLGTLSVFKRRAKIPYSAIVAYVSDDVLTALSRLYATVPTGDSPMMSLKSSERGTFLGDIVPLTELDSQTLVDAGVTSADQGLIILGDFRNRKSILRHFMTLDRTEPFMKDTGYHFGLTGWSGTSEIIIKQPERFLYVKHGAAAPTAP